jgi:Flp pilus assembly protein TadG
MNYANFVHWKKRAAQWSRRTRPERAPDGQSAVEMALLLPLLLLIIFGIIITVFIFYARIQVSNAAREGARAGSIYRLTQFDTGWTLEGTVRNTIYNSSTGQSALGFLSPTSPSFNVANDVKVTLADGNPSDTCPLNASSPCPGDKLNVRVTYSYTVPIVAVALPMFPQPLVMQSDVMMEIQ